MLAPISTADRRGCEVELVMRVSRGEDDRLIGTISPAQGVAARDFSGVLELMRVFEELVPVSGSTDELTHPRLSD